MQSRKGQIMRRKNKGILPLWGQFHQQFGANCKCASSYSSAPVGAFQFYQQNYAQLHHHAQLENTLNF
jgi:hypothetical protein